MDMTEKDDRLVNRFFAEHSGPVSDKGFSERVMKNLPDRAWCLSRIWGVLCVMAGIILFVRVRGWEILGAVFQTSFLHGYHLVSEKIAHIKLMELLSRLDLSVHTLVMLLAGVVTVTLVLLYNVLMDEKENKRKGVS
ncbi:MAG: DUF5056 domain-containing protein [Prevotella sp.]|jgi:hypothetical protein|nr:DUF5056 domain-containing protein [Prevotella sp.]MCH4186048.1 DUF5056 domain-containing protein [Prevotella sp.]MCH4250874.1 DUF5056 domain-containing protein [Prevotella sp.]MCI1349822.1 DUF5056 domain-containing protein [Prevotella sp.]MCI1371289.1 DUF5056 domain-containing protein [Prevotella sp.]